MSGRGVPGPGPADLAGVWDARYSHPNYVYGYRPNDFLRDSAVLLKRQGRVLVLGDGEGRNGVWLAQKGHRVTTVDLSRVGVRKAQALARERGVSLDARVGDLRTWLDSDDAQGPWDGVVSIFCHLPSALRRQVAEILTPRIAADGVLIVESYSTAQPSLGSGGPSEDDLLLTRDRVRAEWPRLALDVRLVERRIFEGMGHQGLSSVVQVLGRPRRPSAAR